MTTKRIAEQVADLRCNHINDVARMIDWNKELGPNLDGFTYAEAQTCSECGDVVVATNLFHEEKHGDFDYSNPDCEGYINSEGPMMNYFYPCDFSGSLDDAAKEIKDLPLCVIELEDGSRGLALTGGGMDLSWSICEAYVRLGFLPPTAFCSLPAYAGLSTKDEGTAVVLAAAKRSAKVASSQGRYLRDRLNDLEKSLRQK